MSRRGKTWLLAAYGLSLGVLATGVAKAGFAGPASVPALLCQHSTSTSSYIGLNGLTYDLSHTWTCPIISLTGPAASSWWAGASTNTFLDYTFATSTNNNSIVGRVCDQSFSSGTITCSYNALSNAAGNHDEKIPGFASLSGTAAGLSGWDYYTVSLTAYPTGGIGSRTSNLPTMFGVGIN